jgi:hypothetical protein
VTFVPLDALCRGLEVPLAHYPIELGLKLPDALQLDPQLLDDLFHLS